MRASLIARSRSNDVVSPYENAVFRSSARPRCSRASAIRIGALDVRFGESPELAATIREEGDATPADVFYAQDAGSIGVLEPQLAELPQASLKYAKRLALISPEALVATKLSINRGADAAGFRNALLAGLDIVAPLYAARTEFGDKFHDITVRDGLGAALKWRGEQFKE